MKKQTLRRISTLAASAVIAAAGLNAFADTTVFVPVTLEGIEQGSAVQTGSSEAADDPSAPQSIPADIRANYIVKADNEYEVKFTSWTALKDYSDLAFTITLAEGYNAEITDIQNSSDLYIKTSTRLDENKGFSLSGCRILNVGALRPVLCTVTLKAPEAPTAKTLVFKDFSAKNTADNSNVSFNPTFRVKQGADRHSLSEAAQAVYDEITALPEAGSLSFYTTGETAESKVLTDTGALNKKVTDAANGYKNLSDSQKKMFADNLEYDNKTLPDFDGLIKTVTAMNNVYDAVRLSFEASSYTDALLKNMFVFNIYTSKVKDSIKNDDLTDKLKTELDEAVKSIEDKAAAAAAAFAELDTKNTDDREAKLINLTSQLNNIQSKSTDKFYSDYLSDLLAQATALKKDIADNVSDKDTINKNGNLEYAENVITNIKSIQSGISSLPTFESPSLYLNYSYDVKFSRKSSASPEASIEVVVYNQEGTKIDSKTQTFAAGTTDLTVQMVANSNNGYKYSEPVTIAAYYILQGARFELGSYSVNIGTAYNPNRRPSDSGSSGGSSGGSGGSSGGSTSGGTKFPSSDDSKTPTDVKPIEPEKNLFNDIDNYSWAKDSIESLYYAGVVNGMEEGQFNPSGSITREQFCKMVVQLFGVLDYNTKTDFVDVKADAWYAPYITSAINAGYIQGQSGEYFGVGESIMRQDMATILYRALGNRNSSAVLNFTDTDSIAPYAKDAVSELVGLNIINGYEDGTFKPRGTATRAEAAKMIWGVYNLLKK